MLFRSHVSAEEIAGDASRNAFTELEKTSAFTAEYYLLQSEVSHANAEGSFDSAEAQLRERYASDTVLFEFYSAARLKQWQAIYSEYRAVIDKGGELGDSEWLFVEMYDNVLSLPGLSDVLDSDADRKSTRLNSSHPTTSRMPSSA